MVSSTENMDLLQTILQTVKAESYLELFKKSRVDCSTLPTLSYRDLEIIGVDQHELRLLILQRTSTLVIPREIKTKLVFDDEYMFKVLTEVSANLRLHNGCILNATARKNVVLCYVNLHNASQMLINYLSSFENTVELLEQKLKKKGKRSNKFWNFVGGFVVLGSSALSVFLIRKFVLK